MTMYDLAVWWFMTLKDVLLWVVAVCATGMMREWLGKTLRGR